MCACVCDVLQVPDELLDVAIPLPPELTREEIEKNKKVCEASVRSYQALHQHNSKLLSEGKWD